MSPSDDQDVQHGGWWTWAWWGIVGAAFGVGIVGLLTVGPVFLIVGLVMTVLGLRSPRLRNESAYTVLVGVAAAPLFLAWVNRSGPGEVCRVQGEVTECSDQWSPWPFLVVVVLLVAAGVLLARRSFLAGRSGDRRWGPLGSSRT